jgi:P-type E1-E2 ATPase
LVLEIPGRHRVELDVLLLDVNGTLTDRGALLVGVAERLAALQEKLEVRLLSADTFGTLDAIARELSLPALRVASAAQKVTVLRDVGSDRCVAIGNGTNDGPMLAESALGIAVIGPEGCSAAALAACDLVCHSVVEALDLLVDPRVLAATLRA